MGDSARFVGYFCHKQGKLVIYPLFFRFAAAPPVVQAGGFLPAARRPFHIAIPYYHATLLRAFASEKAITLPLHGEWEEVRGMEGVEASEMSCICMGVYIGTSMPDREIYPSFSQLWAVTSRR